MILGDLNTLEDYKMIIPHVQAIRSYIETGVFGEFGQMNELSEHLKVIYLNDWNRNNSLFESHRKYYDLHFTLKGKDRLRVCLGFDNTSISTNYDNEKDYSLFAGSNDIDVILRPRHWAFISPSEPHRNEFIDSDTEKLVFKIATP
jgi:YhcH/YjgK/YiaL family protein